MLCVVRSSYVSFLPRKLRDTFEDNSQVFGSAVEPASKDIPYAGLPKLLKFAQHPSIERLEVVHVPTQVIDPNLLHLLSNEFLSEQELGVRHVEVPNACNPNALAKSGPKFR